MLAKNYKEHFSTIHNNKRKYVSCPYCKIDYSTKSNMRRHVKRVHEQKK